MNHSKKYGRSLHAQFSPGTTSDDRFMPNGYVEAFGKMDRLVLTEKLDGQNNCLNQYGVFARSHTSASAHPWDRPLWDRWQLLKKDLGHLEVFGENMYGIHSIAYKKMESFFYVFAVREGERWLSWEEVKFYAALLDFPTVPEIPIKYSLISLIEKGHQENNALIIWFNQNLGMTWEASLETPGLLGGYDPANGKCCCEGYVVRNAAAYEINAGVLPVASNEFDSLFKIVRESHVKTDVHWTKTWKPAKLIDYRKYKWYGYEYR